MLYSKVVVDAGWEQNIMNTPLLALVGEVNLSCTPVSGEGGGVMVITGTPTVELVEFTTATYCSGSKMC
jgi:hypothetical protein